MTVHQGKLQLQRRQYVLATRQPLFISPYMQYSPSLIFLPLGQPGERRPRPQLPPVLEGLDLGCALCQLPAEIRELGSRTPSHSTSQLLAASESSVSVCSNVSLADSFYDKVGQKHGFRNDGLLNVMPICQRPIIHNEAHQHSAGDVPVCKSPEASSPSAASISPLPRGWIRLSSRCLNLVMSSLGPTSDQITFLLWTHHEASKWTSFASGQFRC